MVITWGKCDVRFSQLSADYQEVGEILSDERQHTSKREKYAGMSIRGGKIFDKNLRRNLNYTQLNLPQKSQQEKIFAKTRREKTPERVVSGG
jgi:hypothetical protein